MEIKGFGDQVKINAIGDITVANYSPNVTSITPQQLNDQQTVLEIDQAKYFAFYIDDVDNAQIKPKLMGEAMRKSAYSLADAADELIAGFHTDAGVTVSSTVMTVATSLGILAAAGLALDRANVQHSGRWAVIPPWLHTKLVLNGVLNTQGSIDATSMYQNGFVGRAYGFELYLSNNLTAGLSTLANTNYGLAGVNRAISFAEQIVKMEAYRPENAFSDAVKGLHVYGAKVIDPSALVRLNIASSADGST